MLALWEHQQLAAKDLARLLQLDPGTLTPLLKRLEAAGLVRRDRDPHDQRSLALTLTDAGRELRARAEEVPGGVVARLGLPVEDLVALHASLSVLIAASQRALAAPEPGSPQAG